MSRGARGREFSLENDSISDLPFFGSAEELGQLVVDNEGNTFWCAKYESIVGR